MLVELCKYDFKTFFCNYPSKILLISSITLVAVQNHTHTDRNTSETQSNMVPSLQILFPMPQLTTDSDRVVVIYIAPSDVMEFNILNMM